MGTTLHSFMDIFDTKFPTSDGEVTLKKIVIPLIQRDYAQGRLDSDITRVRNRFLFSLYNAITKEPITLDFVYGDIDENGTMTPLDGQQRLTTLFLLHWYAAKKELCSAEKYAFLERFSYETRYSARYFCYELVRFSPSFTKSLSKEIINQAWFPLDWKKDPTISSMLVMLDAIDAQFKDVPDIWERLAAKAITFYFLPIKDMGLTDELYIKMNSRGKPLTLFEHFKAELEREARRLDEQLAERIISKIDRTWTDLLWQYRNNGTPDDNIVDDEFLRYFKFICDVICYRKGLSPQGYRSDEFDLLQRYFSADNPDAAAHFATLESFFDCWCNIEGFATPAEFLASFMSTQHKPGGILVDSRNAIDIFEDCLHTYSERTGLLRQFPLNRFVLLYAITVYLQHKAEVSKEDFARRIRIINNLIQNSEDEVSDRSDRSRIPAILSTVDTIILTGTVDDNLESNFNVNQLREEKEKIAFLANHPESAETLFALEDHPMFKGQISILGLEHLSYADRFTSLFTCSWDKIDCALMAMGNYGQQERNQWRYQYASQNLQFAWDALFHKSANTGFENTKNILIQLLSTNESFSDKILEGIVAAFITECEKSSTYPWRYYYVKYSVFRPGSYGKLSNREGTEKPYLFSVMQTKSQWSENTYMPYLKAADDAHLSKDEMGQYLIYGDYYIYCENTEYLFCEWIDDTETVRERIEIEQNDKGVDTEDRILKLKAYLKTKRFS